jgi:hypothetical protein
MPQIFTKCLSLHRFGILFLANTIASVSASNGAAAAAPCNFQPQNPSGKLTNEDSRAVAVLITNFFFQTYDSPMTDAAITQNLSNMFTPSDFTFEFCSQDSSLFLANNDFAKLDVKIRTNYHSLWDNYIVPKHNVTIMSITPVGPNTVQENSVIDLHLYSPQGITLDYTALINSTIVKDSNGTWRFKERYFTVNPLFTLASYGR